MHTLITANVITFHPERPMAQAVADANNAADADWSYRVEEGARGFFVAVYDETGERLGTL